jgi:hypothetical protein
MNIDIEQRYHPDMIRLSIKQSLAELKMHRLHIYYPVPDRAAPYRDLFRGINTLYEEDLFSQQGLTGLHA